MAPALVSIVTPVLNGARFLPECLKSVAEQTHPRVEHIVVDGGSTDGTLEIARAAPGVRLVEGRDRGMYDALRRGFELARGDLLAYQNADDRYADPQALAAAVAFLEARPEVDLAWGEFRFIDAHGRVLSSRPRRRPPSRQDAILGFNYVPPHATLLRARALREADLLPDPSLQYAGDWEWYVRLHLAGRRFAHLPRVLAEFRLHPGSKTATFRAWRKLREWRRICRRHGLSFARLAWNELVFVPLRYRLRLAPA